MVMEIDDRNEREVPYISLKISAVEEITSKWSVIQEKKDHVEKLLSTVSIDYSSQEIKEIGEAVVDLLTRYKDKINDRKHYKIRRIEPCGSMREHTAVWKHGWFKSDREQDFSRPFIEFDYLAVLEKPCCYKININPCKCCAKVKRSDIDKPCSCEVPNCSRVIEPDNQEKFDDAFKEELCKSVESLCDCYCVHRHESTGNYCFKQKSIEQQQRGCDKCSVYKPTGQLRIDSEIVNTNYSYSLMLMWTSDTMKLVAPEGYITDEIKTTSPIKHLPILIDFLPALEVVNTQKNEGKLEHKGFLVPKMCHLHFENWRLSCSVREIDYIVNEMSEEHRNCYMMLKYMCIREGSFMSSYHVKTSALNHSWTCSDSSEDYRNCVTAVLKELKIAYEGKVLKSFCYEFDLLEWTRLKMRCLVGSK